jgi:hypothetical protein
MFKNFDKLFTTLRSDVPEADMQCNYCGRVFFCSPHTEEGLYLGKDHVLRLECPTCGLRVPEDTALARCLEKDKNLEFGWQVGAYYKGMIGKRVVHAGNRTCYEITGIQFDGEHDKWGFAHKEADNENAVTIFRSFENFFGALTLGGKQVDRFIFLKSKTKIKEEEVDLDEIIGPVGGSGVPERSEYEY